MTLRLDGKTVLVTGAASGIGLALSKIFIKEGARLVMADINADRLEKEAAAIDAGDSLLALPIDITDPESIASVLEKATGAGFDFNVLVNNAAVIHVGNLLQTELKDLRRVFGVNVEGTFNVTHAVLPGMIERGGGVVLNMASLAGLIALRDRFAYGASKAAVRMMTRAIAHDFVKEGIRANCICAARVHTELVDNYIKEYYAGKEEEMFRLYSEYQPIGRMIEPHEVAHLAVYLCSDESAMTTGGTFTIDGGVLSGN